MTDDDSAAGGWERVEDEPAEIPHPDAPQARLEDYRPLGRRANLARASLVLVTLASVVAVVFDVAERSLLARVGTGEAVTFGELDASDDRQLAISLVQTGLWIVTAIFFIAWLHRAYKNLGALGVVGLRFGAGWAIGSWFVPFLNLVRPKQIVNDVWRGSDPSLDDRLGWRDAPVPLLFAFWWGAYLVAGAVGGVAARLLVSAKDAGDLELSSAVYIATDGLTAVAGILGLVVVDMTTARQAASVASSGGSEHPGARASRWLRGGRRLAAAAALCAGAAGAGVLVVAVQPGDTAAPTGGSLAARPSANAPSTFSLSDDFSDPASGWIVGEEQGVSNAYERGEYRITVKPPDMSWFSMLELGVAVDRMQFEADSRLESSASDDAGVGVGCFVTDLAGYFATIWPDGYYAVGLDPEDSEKLALLADGAAPNAIAGAGQTNRVGIICESGPPAIVTLTVDGRPVAEARHQEGLGAFQLAALIVTGGPDEGATAYFDNVAVSPVD